MREKKETMQIVLASMAMGSKALIAAGAASFAGILVAFFRNAPIKREERREK